MARKPADNPARGDGDEAAPGRIAQLRMVFALVHRTNPRAIPLIALGAVAIIGIFVVVGLLTGQVPFFTPIGVLAAISASMVVFSRYAQSAQYKQIEGQPGAAAAVLQSMRGDWTVTPAVTGNRNMDVVHRVVGRPGVVLVGEGNPTGLASLLAAEKKRTARVAYDVPIYDFQVGSAQGQLPIRRLHNRVVKLPRNLKRPQVADLNYRLKALPQTLQAPKGPMPRSARPPRGSRPKMR